jgi:hypothetical protein
MITIIGWQNVVIGQRLPGTGSSSKYSTHSVAVDEKDVFISNDGFIVDGDSTRSACKRPRTIKPEINT